MSPNPTATYCNPMSPFCPLDGENVKLSLNASRQKTKNLHQHPECALFILDRANPYRALEIRAWAELTPDPDYVFADTLGGKYKTDLRTMDRPGEGRVVVTLRPVKINTNG